MKRDMNHIGDGLLSLGWKLTAKNDDTGELAFQFSQAHEMGVKVTVLRLTGVKTMVMTALSRAGEETIVWTDVSEDPVRSAFELLGLDFWNLQGEFVDTAPEGIRLIPDLQEMVDGAEQAEKDKPEDIVEE